MQKVNVSRLLLIVLCGAYCAFAVMFAYNQLTGLSLLACILAAVALVLMAVAV